MPALKSSVSLSNNQVISALVFFQTAGGGVQTLKLQPPQISWLDTSLPKSVSFALSDTGNMQTIPRGYVTLYKGNKLLAKSII